MHQNAHAHYANADPHTAERGKGTRCVFARVAIAIAYTSLVSINNTLTIRRHRNQRRNRQHHRHHHRTYRKHHRSAIAHVNVVPKSLAIADFAAMTCPLGMRLRKICSIFDFESEPCEKTNTTSTIRRANNTNDDTVFRHRTSQASPYSAIV